MLTGKAEKLIELAENQVGGAYVFGAWGDACTPAHRMARARLVSKARAKTIYADCPVLSGKQATCAGCPHEGKIEADCRGFTDWLLKTAGVIDLYGDTVTTQYNAASNWDGSGGTVDALPDTPCILFRRDAPGRYGHTGLYDGAGYAIHAKGHKAGIVREAVGKTSFTHWRYPRGLYTDTGGGDNMRTLRKGASGADVTTLQTALVSSGQIVAVDGKFGVQTQNAVIAFQQANGLTADGIVGALTWAALGILGAQTGDTGADDEMPAEADKPVARAEFDALAVMVNALRAELDALKGAAE